MEHPYPFGVRDGDPVEVEYTSYHTEVVEDVS